MCSRNRLRSSTAERVFADCPGVQTQSTGLAADAQVQLTPGLLQEAEVVLAMERPICSCCANASPRICAIAE
ncbi:hypothetical protein [Xanthomonas fragariae]|uniref:hypothetical protein n=1 Tax=Xanthomonas fragariae TaxID=48664 RepID=UPI003D18850F